MFSAHCIFSKLQPQGILFPKTVFSVPCEHTSQIHISNSDKHFFTDFKISAGIPPPSAFHTVSQRKPSPLVTSQFVGTSSVVSLTRTSPVRVQEVAVLFNAVHPAPLRTKFNTKHRSGHSPLKCWGPFTSNKVLWPYYRIQSSGQIHFLTLIFFSSGE